MNYYSKSVVKTVYFMGQNDIDYLSSSQKRVSVNQLWCELSRAINSLLTCGINIFYCSHHAFSQTAKGFTWLSGSWVYKFISMGVAPHDMHTDYVKQKFADLFPNKCRMSRNKKIYIFVLLSCQIFCLLIQSNNVHQDTSARLNICLLGDQTKAR